jgi:endosialidase-like protein
MTVMNKLLLENCRSLLRFAFPFTMVAAMCFPLLPRANAVVPAPDGGYPGANTAEGQNALFSRTTGVWNTANGFEALKANSTGNGNTGLGFEALLRNLGGHSNTAVGAQALINANAGSRNVGIGWQAGINITNGSDNIDIGSGGGAGDTRTIRIGKQNTQLDAFMAGIHGNLLPDNGTLQPVFVNNDGKLGTVLSPSSARFKQEIKPMGNVSEAILALKPVTFRYKKEIDQQGLAQFGLVAEEVAKINPDLVRRDDKGQIYSVRYEAVNAMLLNEFLKEHQKVQQLEATTGQQAKAIESLNATVKEQAAQIQKVSAQLETTRPVPQVVANK